MFKKKKVQPHIDNTTGGLSIESLRKQFEKCHDIQFKSLKFNQNMVTLIYCTGMINNDILYQIIPRSLEMYFSQCNSQQTAEMIIEGIHLPTLEAIESEEQAISDIFSGKLLLDFGLEGTIFTLDISNQPQRKTEETTTEVSVKGARDNFIEDININIALIRKRLRTTSLVSETLKIGKRSKTNVAILYIEDIADHDIYLQLKKQLSEIDVDALLSGTQLEELTNKRPYVLFPRHHYTGKPDLAVQSLLNARFVILIDGTPYAYIIPVNFFYLLKSSEDKENPFYFNSLERLLRVNGIFISSFLPGFWVTLTTVHQDQLPLTLLATVVESRRGVPLPTALEAILMLLVFELFRESGGRLPTPIGPILSVVGGLIIGDAAINAGFTSPAMIVVIATSTVATFTLGDQGLIGTISLIRLLVIILSSLFGFVGFFFSIFFIGGYLARIETFGIPYLASISTLDSKSIWQSIFKVPAPKEMKRPEDLHPIDATKKGNDKS